MCSVPLCELCGYLLELLMTSRKTAIPFAEAIAHLTQADRRMAQLIERVGPCTLKLRHEHSIFYSLLRSIIYQQLAGSAAAAILGRVDELFPGALATPEQIAAAPEKKLRAAGSVEKQGAGRQGPGGQDAGRHGARRQDHRRHER